MKVTLIIILVAGLGYVEPHGHLTDPLSRTSLWTNINFPQAPPYWNNQGIWCINVKQAVDVPLSTCGRCGEAAGGNEFSLGGTYGLGIIAKNYTAGSVINITASFQAAHFGYSEFELCPQEQETDTCFQKLAIVGGSEDIREDDRICVSSEVDGINYRQTAQVQLPPGVTCERCTLRWTYRTSYRNANPNWHYCFDPNPAQTFRNCADIRIQ